MKNWWLLAHSPLWIWGGLPALLRFGEPDLWEQHLPEAAGSRSSSGNILQRKGQQDQSRVCFPLCCALGADTNLGKSFVKQGWTNISIRGVRRKLDHLPLPASPMLLPSKRKTSETLYYSTFSSSEFHLLKTAPFWATLCDFFFFHLLISCI